MTKRIAMWSGPRNISTAMMRSFENRADCSVVDEPFYAYYLKRTGDDHPGRDEVLVSQNNSYQAVADELAHGDVVTPVQYQKHMTHHWFEGDDLDWATELTHCFLIRDPREIVASYARVRGECSLEEIGVVQQAKLYQLLCEQQGRALPVVDTNEILKNPRAGIASLCNQLEIPFDEGMLAWPAGKRDTDGVWAPYWYRSVEASTGFKPYAPMNIELSDTLADVAEQAMHYYNIMASRKQVAPTV